MPVYKLMYFNFRALAEPIRFLFIYGGVKFHDYRYTEEEWVNRLKSKAPFGQGPLLEIDGKVFWQSLAIQRHIAELVGVAGNDNWEKLQVDIIVESIWDVRCVLYKWYFYTPDKTTEEEDIVFNKKLPEMLEKLDKILEQNGGFFIGGKITWPDLQYTAYYEYLNVMAGRNIESERTVNLTKLRAKVSEIPSIKKWIENRPKTEW